MEPSNQYGTVVQKPKWQLRWGHILLALFFIVLVVIAYIVVHQINSADKLPLANGTANHQTTSKNNNSKSKSPSNSKTSKSSNSSSSKPSTSTSTGSTNSTNSNNTTDLANTGPGDTTGLFIGATVLGTLGHYLYTKRRLGLTE